MSSRSIALSVPFFAVFAALAGACAAPVVESQPDPEPVEEAEEALCADGTIPGCGVCDPDPSSPKGGYQTCWGCNDTTSIKACVPPPPCGGLGQACCTNGLDAPCDETWQCDGVLCVQPRCDHWNDTCCSYIGPAPYFTPDHYCAHVTNSYGYELTCDWTTNRCFWLGSNGIAY